MTIPRGVWVLGLVSLCMDLSSEMIHALLPTFLVGVLGASVTTLGWLEGLAEAIASITKVVSGSLSDRLGRRKPLTVLGYGLAALTKPLFALAPTIGWVFAARSLDRLGKGIRGAPRDALIAELSPPAVRGASFGLRQSLDTVGAFGGPLLAVVLMWVTANEFRTVFWLAVVPAAAAVGLLVFFVKEPTTHVPENAAHMPIAPRALGARYWWLVLVAVPFTLARSSEAFLILKASETGLGLAYTPMVLVVMNLAYGLSAYPAGWLSDRIDRIGLLTAGAATLVVADVVLAVATDVSTTLIGISIWGLHLGLTQGLFAALIADVTPSPRRGAAFGFFNFASGIALLVASVVAGVLWDFGGAALAFATGAVLALVAAGAAWIFKQMNRDVVKSG